MNDFGSRLKRLREAKRMTQEQLADATGILRSSIARYETRDMGITVETAGKLATALGCTIDELIGRRGTQDAASGNG